MTKRKLQLQFLLVLLAGVLLLSFFILKPFLAPLALAMAFSVVLYPLYRKILQNIGNHKVVAALATLFLSFVCLVIPLTFLGTQIFHEASQLYGSLIQGDHKQNTAILVIESLGKTFDNFLPGTGNFFINLSNNFDTYVKGGLEWIIHNLGSALSGISTLLVSLFIFLISLYYLLLDGPKLKQAIIKLSPLNEDDNGVVFGRLESAVNSVIKGSLLIAVIQGILTAIGFTIFGIPHAILWGTITVIAALIPSVGTSLVILPGVIYLFITGSLISAVGLMIWGLFAVGLIDNMLYPKLVGRELQLPPLLVLLSVLGGIVFFGPVGIFVGPITMSLLFALIYIYSHLANLAGEK